MNETDMKQVFDGLKATVDNTVANMMPQEAFLKQYCPTAVV